MTITFSYHVEITGEHPPLRFNVYRRKEGTTQQFQVGSGAADSVEDAIFMGNEMAREYENKIQEQQVKRTFHLFDVEAGRLLEDNDVWDPTRIPDPEP